MKTQVRSFAWLMAAATTFTIFPLAAQDLPTTAPRVPVPSGPIAIMEFVETTYDFGVVEEGTIVSQVFTFTNTSDEPLILMDAKGSCGCTVPQWPREPIMPGETASLTVEFNSRAKLGARRQRVTLTANTDPPQTFIYLTGQVAPRNEVALEAPSLPKPESSPDCFAIYPNPTAEVLRLEMRESILGQPAVISIYAKNGQLMARREINAVEGTIEFNVSHYPPGTYVANVQIAGGLPEARCFVVVDR